MAAGGEHKKKRKPEKRGAEDGSKLRKPAKKARKEATDTLSAPAELRTSLLVEADDPDFPRGFGPKHDFPTKSIAELKFCYPN
ncbi:hypothetical protein BHE74_00047397 [Ensete ventricosum]|nr:hypothetical protein BHE74_00047397 [Ensete ventricosum]